MRILLAGASGFLGSRLLPHLRRGGHDTVQLVRREPRNPGQVRWDPASGTVDAELVSTVDAVVNLAGAGVGDRRWTREYKEILVSSRVEPTRTLARAIAAADRPPRLLNSSAVGFYGDTDDRTVDEQSPPGQGFTAELCKAWEASSHAAEDAGVRVVRLRTGFPLHASGGLLKPILIQFKLFAGGRMGNGRQYLPWISLPDWLAAIDFLLAHNELSGPVNLTGPQPVTNRDFSAALAHRLHRPNLLPVPGFALRAVVGEFGVEALASQRVLPAVLLKNGFAFQHPTVDDALRAALS